MRRLGRSLLGLGFGALWLAAGTLAFAPVAEAQFFNWFSDQPAPRPKARKPGPPPGDDLPPIVPKESTAPPPPDDRPYDNKLTRLAEILGALHYLRELCGAQEGQLWRNQMREIVKNEGTTAIRRAKLVNSFNDGYRGYRRTYRTCTPSAATANDRFSTEGARIAAALAQSSVFASRSAPQAGPDAKPAESGSPSPTDGKPAEATKADGKKDAKPESGSPGTAAGQPSGANKNEAASAEQAKPAGGAPTTGQAANGKTKKKKQAPEPPD